MTIKKYINNYINKIIVFSFKTKFRNRLPVLKSNKKKTILMATGALFSAILIFVVFLCPLLLITDESIDNKGATEIPVIRLSNSGSGYLNYWDYFYESHYVGYCIKWSFESTNSHVGITVLTMDQDQYDRYLSGESYTYYTLSDGSYIKDSGRFVVPHADYWHIWFINYDSDSQQTFLSYDVTFEQVNPITIIVSIIVVLLIVSTTIAIVLILVKNKRPKKIVNLSAISPQQTKINNKSNIANDSTNLDSSTFPNSSRNWYFCPYCGKKTGLGAQYCMSCGRMLDI